MFKGVIFDLDGVIVSTDKFHYLAWKKLADRERINFDENINNRLRGISRRESLMIVLEKSHKPYSESEILEMLNYKNDIYKQSLAQLTPNDILPGILDVLSFLKEKKIKTAIGSSSKNARHILKQIGLIECFDYIVDGTMITRTKPDPEVFLLARDGLNLKSEECLVVEDALAGVQAAQAAGIKVCAVGDATSYKVADFNIKKISYLKNCF